MSGGCEQCGRSLSWDEKAICMKLISRNTRVFYCLDCLGEKLGCGKQPIVDRIQYYRDSGNCVLFR